MEVEAFDVDGHMESHNFLRFMGNKLCRITPTGNTQDTSDYDTHDNSLVYIPTLAGDLDYRIYTTDQIGLSSFVIVLLCLIYWCFVLILKKKK